VVIQQHDHSCQPGGCGRNQWINPAVWQRRDMRAALAVRDVATVYRLLQRYGLSQRAIAALTGQSQSEVSEVIAGRRRVVSYELLSRIAGGLGIPRGWMGLAYDADMDGLATASGGAA
jgi:predicted XRE-type DNA-binding protein